MHLFDVMAASQVISCLQSSSLDESWRAGAEPKDKTRGARF